MNMTENKIGFLIVVIIVAIASVGVTYLLVNIFEKKNGEQKSIYSTY